LTLAARHADDSGIGPGLAAAQPFDRAVLEGSVLDAARALLGALLVRDDGAGLRVARIVETEAYAGPADRASHARAGRTARTAVMFGPAGHAYVYLVYGMHHCLNVVCGPDGEASAVLIRAVEPLAGIERMREGRGPTAGPDARLGAGPARLCQALDIDRRLDGIDLLEDHRLSLARPEGRQGSWPDEAVVSGPRIGVAYAGAPWTDHAWRFGIPGHPSLSRPFPKR
jgi:DNA-3-methyladenine glycosylase